MMLIILAGLPGVGKTTLARRLAKELGAVYLRIDTIEQAMREYGAEEVGGMGYVVGYRLATENLKLGRLVVADSVNPWMLTREAWRQAAAGFPYAEIEVFCSDPLEHRRRVETRVADIEGHVLPTWQDVADREYHPWDSEPFRLDTATFSEEELLQRVLETLQIS